MARTVLVADDSRVIRETLCRIFEAEENYDLCAEATNGQEAIELALKHRPELIILDFSMPVMNGIDAAKELKKLMPASTVKIASPTPIRFPCNPQLASVSAGNAPIMTMANAAAHT